jgi:hypothetical protein
MPRGGHAVQFYTDDSALIDLLTGYVGCALVKGDAAVVVATPEHRAGLWRWLRARCFDLDGAVRQGRYADLDAAELLEEISIGGMPSATRMSEVIVPTIERLARSGRERRHVSVYGEMVALLWAQQRRDAAIELERLWNELSLVQDFSLCCAYPMSGFDNNNDAPDFLKVCNHHSHLFPADRRSSPHFPQFS